MQLFKVTETLNPKGRRSFGHRNKSWSFTYGPFGTRGLAAQYIREHTTRPSMTISGRSQRWEIKAVEVDD